MQQFNHRINFINRAESLSILQTTLDSINDGVLVVSGEGNIITYNHKFLELWSIPESLAEFRDDNKLLLFVQNQLKRPDEFLELVNLAYTNPEKHVNDILEFKDGKFFERYSQPQKFKDEIAGRIWCFRDITDQKKFEEEIRSLSVNLENMVIERTNQLQEINAELEEANAELEETNKMLDKEIFERKKAEEVIINLNHELENKVNARTAQLELTNSELKEEIIERKKVEMALRNNLQLMQTLIDSIQYPIVYKNTDGLFLGYNKAYEKLFGTSQESLIGKTHFDIRPKEVAEKHYNVDKALIEKPGFQIYDSLEVDKNGELHDFSVAKSTFQNIDGSVAGIVGILIDVTERNKILPLIFIYPFGTMLLGILLLNRDKHWENKKALKESEERFRATFEQAAVGIVHGTLEGKLMRVNQKFCEILGYTQDELLNMSFMDITHHDDLENDMGNMAKLLKGEINTFSMEKRYFKKDCTTVWANLTVSVINQPLGKHKYVMGVIENISERKNKYLMGVVEDISERKHAEEVVKSSEYTLRTLFEGSSDAILIIDDIDDNEVIDCNPAATELFGYDQRNH